MRISTAQIYSSNVATISQQQAERLHTQQQLSTGMRVLTPSDDPVAAARALVVGQSVALNSMQKESQGVASDSLGLLDKTLGSINDILSYIKDRAIQANAGSLSASEKESLATDISAQFDELMNLANTKDANEEYLFSGYMGNTKPFTGNLAGVSYQGDQGSRCLQVSNSRQIPTNVNGDELFMTIDDGAGGATNMFATISNLVTTLRDATLSGPAYAAAISTAEGQLDNAMDNVLRLDSQTGSRMVEVDALTSMGEDLNVQYSATISRLVGVDYTSAISTYQQQGTYLEAALSTFSKITGLSLFNYIGN